MTQLKTKQELNYRYIGAFIQPSLDKAFRDTIHKREDELMSRFTITDAVEESFLMFVKKYGGKR